MNVIKLIILMALTMYGCHGVTVSRCMVTSRCRDANLAVKSNNAS